MHYLILSFIVIGVGLYAVVAGIHIPYALAQMRNRDNIVANIANVSNFDQPRTVQLTTNESLLLGEIRSGHRDIVTDNNSLIKNPINPPPPPSVVHLRIQIDSIDVYNDHDEGFRGTGEWHLLGAVSCCGGAANSNMPTTDYSFNAPGAKEGEIDTPDNKMNNVTGDMRGGWGSVGHVKFEDVKQDIDVNNTNPLSEININFFGIEDDKITAADLPPLPDHTGNSYVEAGKAVESFVIFLNNLKDVDHLGNVHLRFTKANNYGVGSGSAASDMIYANEWYTTQAIEQQCTGALLHPPPICSQSSSYQDWPDFPDYIINFRIIDRDGPHCIPGDTYSYTTGYCSGSAPG